MVRAWQGRLEGGEEAGGDLELILAQLKRMGRQDIGMESLRECIELSLSDDEK